MKKSFVVIGLGQFGTGIVKELVALRSDCLAIDKNEKAVEGISHLVPNCAICDSTKIEALKELDVESINHAIVAIGENIEETILTVINLKELGVKQITVRINSQTFADVMKKIGATEIIIPEEASAKSLAHQIISDSILDYLKVNEEYSLAKIVVGGDFKETSLRDLNTIKRFDINILGINRGDDFIQPKADDTILPGDILTVFGPDKKINKFDTFLN